MDTLIDWFATLHGLIFESVVSPAAFALGLGNFMEEGFIATDWLLVGLLQMAVMVLVIGPLQRRYPVEVFGRDAVTRRDVRTDVIYTLIHRLGLFRLVLFFSIDPVLEGWLGSLRAQGFGTFHLEDLWPGVTDGAWTSFLMYLVVFDFLNYWLHRLQHQWEWWWALHAVHHSQRHMTQWTDNRNHLLDDLIQAVLWVFIGQLIGIAPSQFVAVVAVTQLSENFQHANLRVSFGRWGERLYVSPRFHRLHHAIGLGHQSPGKVLGGHNFGVLLPWWDMLFGTADFDSVVDATGIRDQVEEGRDYGEGFWAQQKLGLKRFFAAFSTTPRA